MEMILLKIKALQKQNRYSTKAISEEIGVTSQTLYDYFSGKTQISIKNLQKIANVFNVPMTYFFEEHTGNGNVISYEEKSNELKVEIIKLEAIVNEKKKMNLFYWEFTEGLMNNITELLVRIVENTPEMKKFLNKQDETRRIINRINTLEVFSEMKVIINRDFFKYFKKPKIK